MEKRIAILRCAKRLFAKKGYDATSMDEISKCADANKALIYYHFKNKENLYSKILLDSICSIHDSIKSQIDEIDDPENGLKIYIDAFYAQAVKDETFFRILMREIASDGSHLTGEVLGVFLKVLGMLEGIIKKGVDRGIFCEKDAKIVHFLIVGTISFYQCSKALRKKLVGDFQDKEALLKDMGDVSQQLYEIIVRGLKSDV